MIAKPLGAQITCMGRQQTHTRGVLQLKTTAKKATSNYNSQAIGKSKSSYNNNKNKSSNTEMQKCNK